MMKNHSDSIFKELEEELFLYLELGTVPVRRLAGALSSIRNALSKLKDFLKEHPFKNQQEEIEFFKYEKPRFTSEQIFALEMFNIETNKPVTDNILIKAFYEKELQFLDRFFTQYKFLYQYHKFEFKELDALLFVRGAKPSDIILPETAGLDIDFSTSCDLLFGKFMAYDRLQIYLLEEIQSLSNPFKPSIEVREDFIDLKWTGETINLAELGYGIWLTKQINDGNATITEIIGWLEYHFQIKIGTAFRRWQSISRRKRIKPTKYLDQMKEAVLRRLDEENSR
ncbi:RteC domain-containing protein [Mucilaginibacter sp. L196]|uniref:RteC domain-containing protein n=1 Tax=Mucilaginibacter sp. L196 TaxID=1641870 RepID=UPI00131AE47D|nr:RteC domain-containing protein [Mucilaginibacter sp. L196]